MLGSKIWFRFILLGPTNRNLLLDGFRFVLDQLWVNSRWVNNTFLKTWVNF